MKKKNEAFAPKKDEPCGAYILYALDQYFRSGDAYTSDDEAIHICMQEAHSISYRQLRSDMDFLISIGKLVFEGSRLYLAKTKRYEDFAAKELAEILPNNNLDVENAKIEISGGVHLNELQQAGILCKMPAACSLVLIGDPNQLGSVGSKESLRAAMTTPAEPRKSKLVTKTHHQFHFAA